jgi:hypothetical protein
MKLDLDEIKRNNPNPFKVPDNYFDTLSERIMNKIDEEERKSKKVIKMRISFIKRAVSIAAILILGLVITKPIQTPNSNIVMNEIIVDSLSDEEIEYLLMSAGDYEFLVEEMYAQLEN